MRSTHRGQLLGAASGDGTVMPGARHRLSTALAFTQLTGELVRLAEQELAELVLAWGSEP